MSFRSKLTMHTSVSLIDSKKNQLSQTSSINADSKAIKEQKVIPVVQSKVKSAGQPKVTCEQPKVAQEGQQKVTQDRQTKVTPTVEPKVSQGKQPKATQSEQPKVTPCGQLKATSIKLSKVTQSGQPKVVQSGQLIVTPTGHPKVTQGGQAKVAQGGQPKVIISSMFDQQKKSISPFFGPFQPPTNNIQPKSLVPSFAPCITQEKVSEENSILGLPLIHELSNSISAPKVQNKSVVECSSKVVKFSQALNDRENAMKRVEDNQMRCSNPSDQYSGYSSGECENIEKDDVGSRENEVSRTAKKRTYRETTGKVTWCDNIEVDLDEVVEVEEIQENGTSRLGTMEGTILSHHIWHLPKERKIKVHFNEFDQPVRKGALVLMHFLSDISRNGLYCPIGEISWRHVDKHYKDEIIEIVRARFVLPDRIEIDERMLLYVNSKWKHYRWELHRDYYRSNLTKQKMIENMPENVIRDHWIKLVTYWCSDRFKKLSEKGIKAHSLQVHQRTTGSKSYARKKVEFVKEHNREPSSLEFWKVTHEKKEGGYVDGTCTQAFMDAANAKVEEVSTSSQKPLELIENDVFNEMMYLDNEPKQHVVGFGVGVSRSQVFGLKGQLRRRYFDESGNKSVEVLNIRAQLVSMEKKNDETISLLQQSNETLEKKNETLEKKNETLEKEMESFDKRLESIEKVNETLQKQNDLLKIQNEELTKRNDQFFAQFNHMSSLLGKLQKN